MGLDSTEFQTEIEIELESGSKYMCTNSCKHKYVLSRYNDFDPISQLSKYVEIMLFDVVSIEKNAKDKDTALRKISYVIPSQWEHFGA